MKHSADIEKNILKNTFMNMLVIMYQRFKKLQDISGSYTILGQDLIRNCGREWTTANQKLDAGHENNKHKSHTVVLLD